MIATSLALAVVVSAVPVQEAPAPAPAPKATASAPAWPAPAEAPTASTEDSKQEDTKDTEITTPVIPFQAPTTAPTVTAPPAKPAHTTTGQAESPWSFAGWLLHTDTSTGPFAPAMFGGASTHTASSPWWVLTPLSLFGGGAVNPAPETGVTEPAPEATTGVEAVGAPGPVNVADLLPSGTATSTTAGAEGDAGDDTASAPAATETATK